MILSHLSIAENYQEIGFLNLVDSSKNFLSDWTHNEIELGFVMLTGLPGEAVERISGYARS